MRFSFHRIFATLCFYVFEPGKMANYFKDPYCLIERHAIGMANEEQHTNSHSQTNQSVEMDAKMTTNNWLTIRLNDLLTHTPMLVYEIAHTHSCQSE